MSVPKQVLILGRKVKLQFCELDGDLGQFSELPHTIKIQAGLDAASVQRVLIHEMTHAALAIGGVSEYQINGKVEETICTLMETAVPDILKALKRMNADDFDSDS